MTVKTPHRNPDASDPEALIAEARERTRLRRRRQAWAAAAVAALAVGIGALVSGGDDTPGSGPARVPAAAAPGTPGPIAPLTVTGRPAAAVARVGDRAIAAGIGWYGTNTGSGLLAATDGSTRGTPGTFDGQISDAAPDGRGGAYVGGDFRTVGGVAQPFLAHLKADGTLDRAFRARPGAFVDAVAVSGGRVYAGGQRGLVAIDARTGRLARRFTDARSGVAEMTVSRGVVYLDGFAQQAGAPPGIGGPTLQALSARTGRPVAGFRAALPRATAGVSALRVSGGRLWVGLRGRSGDEPGDRPALLRLDPRTGRGRAITAVRGRVDEIRALSATRLLVTGTLGAGAPGGARVVDPRSGRIDAGFRCTAPAGTPAPAAPATAGGGYRAADAGGPASRDGGLAVYDAVLRGGTLWLAGQTADAPFSGERLNGLLTAVDPATCAARRPAPAAPNGPVNALVPLGTAGVLAGGQFWVAQPRVAPDGRFDTGTGRPLGVARGLPVATRALLADGALVWAASYRELRAIDPATGAVVRRFALPIRTTGQHPPESCSYGARGRVVGCRPIPTCAAGAVPDRCIPGPGTPFTASREGSTRTGIEIAVAGDRVAVLRSEYPYGFAGPRLVTASRTGAGAVRTLPLPYPSASTAPPNALGRGRAVSDVVGLDGALYVGGSFLRTRPDGTPANLAVVKLDPVSGRVDAAFDPHVDGAVQSLATDGRSLFLDGLFARPRTALVAVYPVTGAQIPSWQPAFPPSRAGRTSLNDTHLGRVGRRLLVFPRPGGSFYVHPRLSTLDTRTGALVPLPAGGAGLVAATDAPGRRWFVAGQQRRRSTIGSPNRIAVAGTVAAP